MRHKREVISMKELAFVNEYLRNGFLQQKAMMTLDPSLSPQAAADLSTKYMKLPRVQEYLQKRIRAMESESRLTKKFIEDELLEALANCKNAEDRAHVLKTIDIMNKFAGHYNHKQQIDVKHEQVIINYQKPDADDQL
jgi:hypothetical protein